MVFGWCFLRDNWSESLFKRDWLVLCLVLNQAVVGLNRINSVSEIFTGDHLRRTLFLARAALGIVHQGMLPVLCVCSSNRAGVPILEWINKGEGWPCLECRVRLVWWNTLDGCSEGCSFGQNSLNISPHWVPFLCWANCMKLVWETPKISLTGITFLFSSCSLRKPF